MGSLIMNEKESNFWYKITGILSIVKPLRDFEQAVTDINQLRQKLFTNLWDLDLYLREIYSERDAYLILFALVAHCDEIAQLHVQHFKNTGWEPLQLQLFQIDNAGDIFFQQMDAFLYRNDIPESVYEIYFFCMKNGFQGRYIAMNDKINYYMDSAKARISVKLINLDSRIETQDVVPSFFKVPDIVFYFIAIGLIVMSHHFLHNIASTSINYDNNLNIEK